MSDQIEQVSEPAQVSLSEGAHFKLDQMVQQRQFEEMRDGYRFAVAYALHLKKNPERAEGARKTIFGTSTLDPDQYLKLAVDCSGVRGVDEPTYRAIERLADWGIGEISRKVTDEFVSISDIVREVIGGE